MITTTRSIYICDAFDLNPELEAMLFPEDWNDYPSMAEALRQAKISLTDRDIYCVSFVGDPALKLAIPRPKIVLTEINDVAIDDPAVESLKSLGYVKMEGRDTKDSSFI